MKKKYGRLVCVRIFIYFLPGKSISLISKVGSEFLEFEIKSKVL